MGYDLAVEVAHAVVGHQRRQMWRPRRPREPLDNAEVRRTAHADLAVRPRLFGNPFDRVVDVVALLRRPGGRVALRRIDAARIGHDERVTGGAPGNRVRRLDRRIVGDVRALRECGPERCRPTVVFAVGTPKHDRWQRAVDTGRAVDVDVDFDTVTKRDRNVIVDREAVDRDLTRVEARVAALFKRPPRLHDRVVDAVHDSAQHSSFILIGIPSVGAQWT